MGTRVRGHRGGSRISKGLLVTKILNSYDSNFYGNICVLVSQLMQHPNPMWGLNFFLHYYNDVVLNTMIVFIQNRCGAHEDHNTSNRNNYAIRTIL